MPDDLQLTTKATITHRYNTTLAQTPATGRTRGRDEGDAEESGEARGCSGDESL